LDTVTSAGQVIEGYSYDGFDRIGEHRKLVSGALTSTRYAYDPLDRTLSRTEKAGTPSAKTTDFAYLGLTEQLLDERVAGTLTKSYQYGPGGQRLSQTTIAAGGAKTDGFYGYNAHTDVETVTDSAGDTRSTYGYTAYGSNDTAGHRTGRPHALRRCLRPRRHVLRDDRHGRLDRIHPGRGTG